MWTWWIKETCLKKNQPQTVNDEKAWHDTNAKQNVKTTVLVVYSLIIHFYENHVLDSYPWYDWCVGIKVPLE